MTLDTPSPLQLRAELEAMALKDLLGPAGGPEEIVAEANVRGRYIVGLLAPKGQTLLPDDDDDDLAEGGRDTEDGKPVSVAPKSATMLPSSIGLTFSVAGDATAIQITVRYGHYQHVTVDRDGEAKRVWQRTPIEGTSAAIPLKPGRLKPWAVSAEYPDVYVQGLVRKRATEGSDWSLTLFLINGQEEPKQNKDSAWVFQPELSVAAPDGSPIFLKRARLRHNARIDLEEQSMQMLYRKTVEFAVGHGVAVHAELPSPIQGEGPGVRVWDRATRLSTQVAPLYEVPRVTPPTAQEIPALADVVLDMKALADWQGDFATALGGIVTAYEAWIAGQAARLTALPSVADLALYNFPARAALDNCRATLQRIRDGLALLDANPQAAEAFRFANRAMWQQRVRTLYTRDVRQGQPADLAALDVPANRTWYPFQLAFILINLPGLTDPLHPDRGESSQAIADLLWFPTGGGKTEAYLGLTAYTFGIRRLQGVVGGYSGLAGIAVIMRYTLRLLTLQQFQRATSLICACESIRRDDPAKWGAEPFRVGLWVGQRTTPNWTDNSAEAINVDRGGAPRSTVIGGRGSPHQLTNCPWCGNGTRFRTVLIRVNVAFLSAAQKLYETYGAAADPWMTLVGYFNSMRELGGMRRVVDDAIRTRLQKMDDRGLAKRFLSTYSVEELTSRKGATDIPEILDRLEAVFDPQATEERKVRYKAGKKTDFSRNPIHVLLATNMISVGVDVPRLGLMAVASQPKTTAEYIQATSRIGRRWPGLVCVVYNWARPRDLSHYERFEHYHATFFQHVEALSVTPFSPRALDRGLSALLVAYVRLLGLEFNANTGAGRITRDHPYVRNAVNDISRRAGLITGSAALEAYVRGELEERVDKWLARARAVTGGAQLGYADKKDGLTLGLLTSANSSVWGDFTCLNSLRDVEPAINLILDDFGLGRDPMTPTASAEPAS